MIDVVGRKVDEVRGVQSDSKYRLLHKLVGAELQANQKIAKVCNFMNCSAVQPMKGNSLQVNLAA